MPTPDQWTPRSSADTAPASRPETSPVNQQQPAYYQPPASYSVAGPPPSYPVAGQPPPFVPPKKRSPVALIVAFVGLGLFALIVMAVMFVARVARDRTRDFGGSTVTRSARAGETPFTRDNADRVESLGSQLTLTKAFGLGDSPKITLNNVNGAIVITTWDNPQAEVKVIRQTNDEPQVFINNEAGNLSVRAVPGRGNGEARFELKLPQEIGHLDVSTVNGSIKVTDLEGDLAVKSVNGSIDLTDVTGLSKATSVNGNIKAVLKEWKDQRLEIGNVSGNIALQTGGDIDADLQAVTVSGSITLDDSFGVPVEKQMVGQRARGKIGNGGPTFRLNTVSGSIKVSK
jgi:hypothetical protein